MLENFLFASCLVLASADVCAQINDSALPDSLKIGNELVDTGNGFAIRIDQPNFKWKVVQDNLTTTAYAASDETNGTQCQVIINRHHFSEMTRKDAQETVRGLVVGSALSGWTVTDSSFAPVDVPREKSYRFVQKLQGDKGKTAVAISYATSPRKLYLIECTAPNLDEKAVEAFAASFRLLNQ